MKRWTRLVLGWMLLLCAGCAAGRPVGPSRPEARVPASLRFEVATEYQRLPALPGERVAIDGYSAVITAHFDAPVTAARVSAGVAGATWRLSNPPAQLSPTSLAFRLEADLASNAPVTISVDGPVPATLTLQPRTPPLTAEEERVLTALGLKVWALAAAGDEAALKALIAPAAHLSAPGGEFFAGDQSGLPAVIRWAQARPAAAPRVTVAPRKSYASMDLIEVDTGRGKLAIYVTIPGRKLAKLFGI